MAKCLFEHTNSVLPEQVMVEARKGLKFFLSSDAAAFDTLITAAEAADLLISEVTYGENEQAQLVIDHGHMNLPRLQRLRQKPV